MIRILILTSAFLTVTVMLLLMQPRAPELMEPVADVARAGFDPLTTTVDVRPKPRPNTVVASAQADPLQSLSASALSSLSATSPSGAPIILPGELRAHIIQAIGEGRPDDYIQELLRQAALLGEQDVPTALITRRGRLDTTALVEALEARDQSRTVTVTDVQRTAAREPKTYIVQPGDSLAAIARHFYGETGAYDRIYRANRDILNKPDDIRAGQTLVLPGL